jgi:hypothetical protein
VFFGEIELADEVVTDMPAVRDAYKEAGVDVVWIGKRKKKAVKKNVGLRDSDGS